MNTGDSVQVEGVSRKGKNRVREHGDRWQVERVSDRVQFASGTWALLTTEDTHGGRWVRIDRPDEHFRIVG